ncbi:CAP domain-containing protein [Pseudooceanicola sp. HF7]|uniref:CAP domain-containing protein n=1 Tax=Pseudooceanicola sp. HF7 TaxID=2721560 RepID=UPI001430B771|nr:CAP domain-containing protein [Pseudooceanicola sp. HF7]NIZ09656.1 CAP domain-containing protein [Pseudooceanicola sp. HF7]
MRFTILATTILVALSACAPTPPSSTGQLGSDGRPLPKLYRIPSRAENTIPYEVLDSVNTLRAAAGAGSLQLNSELTAAAQTHSNDMSNQGRPWHFGSDGSSPIDRVQRVGYPGVLVGETISETFETEIETLAAWMDEEDTRRIILDPSATDLGFAWHQDRNGKIWWTMVLGQRTGGTFMSFAANQG